MDASWLSEYGEVANDEKRKAGTHHVWLAIYDSIHGHGKGVCLDSFFLSSFGSAVWFELCLVGVHNVYDMKQKATETASGRLLQINL